MKRLIALFIILLVGCSSSRLESPPITSLTPVTQTLDNNAKELTNSVVVLEGAVKDIRTKISTVQIEQPLQNIETATAQIKLVNSDLTVVISKVNAIQIEIQQFNKKFEEIKVERNTAIEERDTAKKLYHDSWFAGKFWRTLYWIVGISSILLIIAFIVNLKTDFFLFKWAFKWLF